MMGVWRGGAHIGEIYRFASEGDCESVGNCWMRGRLRIGDYALCLSHSGDCFYTYMLLERIANGWRGIPQATFGAYIFGVSDPDCHLTSREYHLLAAGEFVKRDEWMDELMKRARPIPVDTLMRVNYKKLYE